MNYIKKYFNTNLWALPLSAWMLFSLFYWYSAYIKPFTPNGFMSWVYVSKCSYFELLTLRDTGIGHPPFFHILQKIIQDILPGYHFLHVRLLNYFIGSIFILLLAKYLLKFKRHTFFILSIPISAAVLNAFVYARMWGGMALFSIIFIILGQSYLDTKKKIFLPFMSLTMLMGLFFDYNFVLMAPYGFFVLITYSKYKRKLQILAFVILILVWITAFVILVYKIGWTMSIYTNLTNIYKMGFNLFNLIFYSWYVEIIVLILIFLGGALLLKYRNKEFNQFHAFLAIVLFLGIVLLLINSGYLRIRYALLFLLILNIFYFQIKNKLLNNFYDNRLILSIVFGSIIILSISPLFWRDLVINRFIIIFLPLIGILIYRNFSDKMLTVFSFFLLLSGISFAFSSYINDSYLPDRVQNNNNTVFENSSFYASQYLKEDINSGIEAKFMSMNNFDFGCRICKMGTDQIDYKHLNFINYVTYNHMPFKLLLKRYKIKKSKILGLTKLDKIQLKYLTPLNRNYSILYNMVKKTNDKQIK